MIDYNSKKIKVMNIMSGISTEGIGIFTLNVYDNIDKEKFDISFALATDYEQLYEKHIINTGGNIYRTYEIGKGIKGKIKHFFNLIKILKKEGPFDVVHSQMDFFNGINLLAAYIAGVPNRISHAHTSINNKSEKLVNKVYHKLMKVLINIFSNEKIGCSNDANNCVNGNGKFIPNGIDLRRFSIENTNKPKNLKIDTKKVNFIIVARIDHEKNPLFLIKVMKELNKIRDDIHLYWAGSGSMKNEVIALIKEYNLESKITLLGVRKDIHNLLSIMDFIILPSLNEGLPITLIEAQACNLPCFISDRITKEVDLGLCTYISLDRDEKEWASIIDDKIKNKTYKNKKNEELMKKFDINNTVKQLENIYLNKVNIEKV